MFFYAIFAVHLFAIGRYARLTQHFCPTKKITTPVNLQTTLIKFQIKLGSQCQWLTFLGGGSRQLPAVYNSCLRGRPDGGVRMTQDGSRFLTRPG
jgi:hypothetical protein